MYILFSLVKHLSLLYSSSSWCIHHNVDIKISIQLFHLFVEQTNQKLCSFRQFLCNDWIYDVFYSSTDIKISIQLWSYPSFRQFLYNDVFCMIILYLELCSRITSGNTLVHWLPSELSPPVATGDCAYPSSRRVCPRARYTWPGSVCRATYTPTDVALCQWSCFEDDTNVGAEQDSVCPPASPQICTTLRQNTHILEKINHHTAYYFLYILLS